MVVAVNGDDQRRSHKSGAHGGTQSDGALAKHHDRVADAYAPRLRPGKTGGGNVGQENRLLIANVVRNLCQVRLGKRNSQKLGLSAIQRIPKAPASDGLIAVIVTALGMLPRETRTTLAAGRDGAYE